MFLFVSEARHKLEVGASCLHHSINVATSLLSERQAYLKREHMICTVFFMSNSQGAFQGLPEHLRHKRKHSGQSYRVL